jgi:TP901 family phage tail tape measure protein
LTTTNVTIKVETQGARKVEQLERSFKKTESAAKQLEGSLGGLIGKFAAVTGVAIGLGNAFNSVVKFDKAQSALRTLGVNAEELTGKLNEVSKGLNGAVSTAELTGAAFQVASAGFKDAGDNAKILEAAAVSAKAKFADLGVVAAATTSVLNSYGLGANKAKEVNDKFFQTIKDGVITIEEYSASIGGVASIAAQSGISLAEINSVIAIATQKGVQASEAFTGLGATISAIIAPSKQAKDLAAELGIEFSEAALRQKGLVAVLEDIEKATGGSNEKLTTLFGSVEALKVLTPSLANN